MPNQLVHPVRGEINNQWYEVFPDRLQEEIDLMEASYPEFTFHKIDGENVYWIGTAKALRSNGNVLYELGIKIECGPDYPKVFPSVYDLSDTLKNNKCPHLTKTVDTYSLCYGNRLDSQLNFEGSTRVKHIVDYICIFLAKQWYFERYGKWPDGQPHGILPFIEHEIKVGTINRTDICPCGLDTKMYKDCHMFLVQKELRTFDCYILPKIHRTARRIGKNQECPCGSGNKWKKCCLLTINHSHSKMFLILKYPNAFGITDDNRDRLLKLLMRSE